MSSKITIINPTITKVRSNEVSDFLQSKEALQQFVDSKQQENEFSRSTQPRKQNPQRTEDERTAKDLYRELCKPLGAKYMDTIVQGTGMKLREVIGNYWFRVPEGHYVTLEYDLFHRIKGNRDIDPAHVAHLINEFEQNGYGFNVAAVNETGGVIDGQHRLAAISYLKELKKQDHPYIFDIIPGGGMDDIEKHNSNRDEWSWENRLQSGIDLGLDAYIRLGDMYNNKYAKRFPISELIEVFFGRGINTKEDFIKRKVEYNPVRFNQAVEFLDKVVHLYNTIYPCKTNTRISSGWAIILIKLFHTPNFTYKKLIERIENPQSPSVFTLQKLPTQAKEVVCQYIIDAYNYKLASNRLPVETRHDLKNIRGGYNNLENISFK